MDGWMDGWMDWMDWSEMNESHEVVAKEGWNCTRDLMDSMDCCVCVGLRSFLIIVNVHQSEHEQVKLLPVGISSFDLFDRWWNPPLWKQKLPPPV